MRQVLLVVMLVTACDSGKPKEKAQSAGGSGSGSAETKPASPPIDAAEPLPADAAAAACAAEPLKEEGMQHINMGEHSKALAKFEESLACKDDPYVRQLAFMESCASSNSEKAKFYYKKLSPAQQAKFAQICIRQNPPVPYE